MGDPFQKLETGLNSPARNAYAVTPDDNTDLPTVSRALWVGTSGDVVAILANDSSAVTFKNVSGFLAVAAKRIKATGTTATNVVALY